MKRKILAVIAAAILITGFGTAVTAEEEITDITIYVDDELVIMDTIPVVRNNRTLVPLRGVLEKLGATVDWNMETRQAIVKDGNAEILLEAGNDASWSTAS